MTRVPFWRKMKMHTKVRLEIKDLKNDIANVDINDKNATRDISIYNEMIERRKRYTFWGW